MPTYYLGGYGSNSGFISGSGSNAADCCCCPSTTKFFETLANKLEEMTLSLKDQFSNLVNKTEVGRGFIIASINVAVPIINVKGEYVEYIRRYGPPQNGIFDPIYLDLIRAEIAAGII